MEKREKQRKNAILRHEKYFQFFREIGLRGVDARAHVSLFPLRRASLRKDVDDQKLKGINNSN